MPSRAGRPVLRCGNHNVNGLATAASVERATAAWRQAGYHVVFVQEHHLTFHTRTAALQRLQRRGWLAFVALSPAGASGRGRGGTAILVQRALITSGELTLVGGEAAFQAGPEGRYAALPVRWGGHHLHLCSVYLPSGDSAAQRRYIADHLAPLSAAARGADRRRVWGGDFNFVPDPALDRLSTAAAVAAHPDVGTRRRWGDAVPGVVDVWRARHPRRRCFTYVVPRHASRLDRFYVCAPLTPCVAACAVGRDAWGDHRPVSLSLVALHPGSLGPPRARVRLAFLSHPSLVQDFEAWLAQELAAAPADHLGALLWWPQFKHRVALRCSALCRAARQLARAGQAEGDTLEALHAQLAAGDASVLPAVVAARQCFAAALAEAEAAGALQRRQSWVHAGERPGPALSRRFQPRKQDCLVPALRGAGGGLLTRGTACAQRVASFWAGVSARPATDPAARQEVLQALAGGRRLAAEQAQLLGAAEVTATEVARALRTAPPGRSPGLDGIPVELYRRFKAILLPTLARLFTAVNSLGQLPVGFTEGLITIIFKSGDRADPANYRPITLLCTDYRLYAKVLALRLNPCLAGVIDAEQTAFVPGRRIGENILALQCLPELLRCQRRWALVVFCDFRKAYDTVDRAFLFSVMRELGLGEGFLAMVRLLLSDTRARATVNRWVSTPEASTAGVRQGCPLAPLLYLFIAQALLRFLKARGIGIDVAGQRLTAFQFADDAEVVLPSLDALPPFLAAMHTFGDASGQRLHLGKTRVLPVGAAPADLPPAAHGLSVVSSATSLGVTFGEAADAGAGWQGLVQGVHDSYARIAAVRRLSVFGRGFASAAYGLSRLLYHAEFHGLPPPESLQPLHAATAKLVDRGQAPSDTRRAFAGVAADMLPGRPADGGFGVLPLAEHVSARHAWWGLQLLLAPAGAPWAAVVRALLAACGGEVGGPPLGLLLWPAGRPLPGAVVPLPQPLRRLHDGLASLPRVTVLAPPPPGPWCWAAPLWGNPLLCSAAYPEGIDLDFLDFAAAGVATIGQLLHVGRALRAVPGPHAYRLVWVTHLRRYYAFADRHRASERLAALLAALPPDWVAAAHAVAVGLAAGGAPPPPEPADALAAMLPCLGWLLPGGESLPLRAFTVRKGTALLTAPQRLRRLQRYLSPFAEAAAGAARNGTAAEAQAVLRRLWRARCANGVKETFWRLAHDAVPTSARMHRAEPCPCGAPPPADRLHHFWGCPVARAVVDTISAAVGAPVPRAAVWLARPPAAVYGGVWDVVCLAAVAAMDHGRRLLWALSTGPPPVAPLAVTAAHTACARFWSHLSDFVALRAAPASWLARCPTGHPFIHVDPDSGSLVLHPTGLAALPPPGP